MVRVEFPIMIRNRPSKMRRFSGRIAPQGELFPKKVTNYLPFEDNLLHANSKLHYTLCSSIFSLNVRRILCRSLRSAVHMANMEIRKCVKWARVRGVQNLGTINLQPKNCSLFFEKSNAFVLSCWSIVSFSGQIQHAPLPHCSPLRV